MRLDRRRVLVQFRQRNLDSTLERCGLTHANADDDSYTNGDLHCRRDPDADYDTDRNADIQFNCHGDQNADRNAYTDRDGHPYCDSDGNGDRDDNPHPDPNGHPYRDSDGNRHRDGHADRDAHTRSSLCAER
jgi:hypothetical protein